MSLILKNSAIFRWSRMWNLYERAGTNLGKPGASLVPAKVREIAIIPHSFHSLGISSKKPCQNSPLKFYCALPKQAGCLCEVSPPLPFSDPQSSESSKAPGWEPIFLALTVHHVETTRLWRLDQQEFVLLPLFFKLIAVMVKKLWQRKVGFIHHCKSSRFVLRSLVKRLNTINTAGCFFCF